jgi:hypothetical protein
VVHYGVVVSAFRSLFFSHYLSTLRRYAGPYYPLGNIGTVPRAYDIFRTYEGFEGEK